MFVAENGRSKRKVLSGIIYTNKFLTTINKMKLEASMRVM